MEQLATEVTTVDAERESAERNPTDALVFADEHQAAPRRLRVVLVSPYGAERDGIARYSSELARELERHGCDVKVVTPRTVVSGSGGDRLGDLLGDRHHLRQRLIDWSPDVVHVQFAVAAFGGRLLALMRLLGDLPVPFVVTAHEVTRDVDRMGYVGRLIYRRLATEACCVMVHTQGAADTLLAICPAADVRVVPHPVLPAPSLETSEDELRRRFNLGDREIVLMFGFVHPHKGLDDLVAAFASARRQSGRRLDQFVLVIAGDVRRRSGLFRVMEIPDALHLAHVRRLIRRFGLERSTVFTGYVPERDVAAWFRVARAAVLPYRKTEQSGVLSLARAYVAPIITSDAGGLGEESGATWTYAAGDRKALARLLERLDRERPAAAATPAAGDLASFAAATEQVYRESLGATLKRGS